MMSDAVPTLRDVILLSVMVIGGSVAVCCFTLIAAMEAYNAWDWWQSEASNRFKSLPRTWMRRLRAGKASDYAPTYAEQDERYRRTFPFERSRPITRRVDIEDRSADVVQLLTERGRQDAPMTEPEAIAYISALGFEAVKIRCYPPNGGDPRPIIAITPSDGLTDGSRAVYGYTFLEAVTTFRHYRGD